MTETIKPEDVVVDPPIKSLEHTKYGVATKIQKILQGGRRYFGSSGSWMTWMAHDPEYTDREEINSTTAKEMLDGERDTTSFLKKWMKDKPNVVLIDSVRVPDWEDASTPNSETGLIEGVDTDHILLIGAEVLLIDTMRWKKKKTYSVSDEGHALMSNKEFPGGKLAIVDSINLWLEYLDEDAYITGFVCINQEETSVIRNKNWYTQNYRLVELDRFEEILNSKWEKIEDYDKTHINSTLASQIIVRCIKPFDQYSRVFDMNSLRDFH